jgi:hypothetical protein
MSVKYLKSIGFRTKKRTWAEYREYRVKEYTLSAADHLVWVDGRIRWERPMWERLVESICEHHLYTTGQEKVGRYNHSGKRHIKNALKYNESTEEYSLKLVSNISMVLPNGPRMSRVYSPLMFGKKSTLFFSGDVPENLRKLHIAFKEGHLDGLLKSHYLVTERKDKLVAKKAKERKKEKLDALRS